MTGSPLFGVPISWDPTGMVVTLNPLLIRQGDVIRTRKPPSRVRPGPDYRCLPEAG